MKNQKPIDAQVQSAEQELAALDEKRKALQARIKKLKGQKQSIADGQLPFDRLSESNVTNDSNREKKETVSLLMITSVLTLINGVTCLRSSV